MTLPTIIRSCSFPPLFKFLDCGLKVLVGNGHHAERGLHGWQTQQTVAPTALALRFVVADKNLLFDSCSLHDTLKAVLKPASGSVNPTLQLSLSATIRTIVSPSPV